MVVFQLNWFEMEGNVARANIRDVAAAAGLSVSTVNRTLHEPDKVREETLHADYSTRSIQNTQYFNTQMRSRASRVEY